MQTSFKGGLWKCLPLFLSVIACKVVAAEPWPDGETLTYEVHWGMFVAAEGTFQARRNGSPSGWRLELDLKSRGVVDMAVPIQSHFVSQAGTESWKSLLFQADRREGRERLNYECVLPGSGTGQYRDLLEKKNRSISEHDGPVQDLVSMLYNLRRHDWKKDSKMRFCVNDRWSLHNGFARVVGRERVEDQNGAERECDVIFVEEQNEKGESRNNGWLRLWFTTDARHVPLQARLKFRYGTFLIRIKPSGQ